MYIMFTSHRARDRALTQIFGTRENHPTGYYSWSRETGKGVYDLTAEQVESIRGIKGWRKLRSPHDDLLRCINW